MPELPSDFEERVQQQLGPDFPAFQDALKQPPPVSIRLNPRKPAALELPIAGSIPWCPEGRYLTERPVFTRDPDFHAGAYYVQEASSQLLDHALRQTIDRTVPLRVLDLCAAPGGKATLLASFLNDQSLLVANETIRSRVGALRENLIRWGWPNVLIANRDPEDFAPLMGFFDVVVVDAPCSGEGLFRKDPNATTEWSLEAAERCALRQRRILTAALPLLRPGGILLYSTCTFNPEENDDRVREVMIGGEAELIQLEFAPEWGITETNLGAQCWPHLVRGEGFYLAALRRSDVGPGYPNTVQATVPALTAPSGDYLKDPQEFAAFVLRNGTLAALPRAIYADADRVCRTVDATPLLALGEIKGRDFVPDHALALSTTRRPDLPSLALDRQTALHYLKKDPFELPPDIPTGWTLATYNDLSLGWLKVLPGRFNNYLPNECRIRMTLS